MDVFLLGNLTGRIPELTRRSILQVRCYHPRQKGAAGLQVGGHFFVGQLGHFRK